MCRVINPIRVTHHRMKCLFHVSGENFQGIEFRLPLEKFGLVDDHGLNQKKKLPYPCLISKYPANIYLFKVYNRNTRKRCDIRSNIMTFKVNDANDVVLVFFLVILVFLLLTLNM